MTVVVKNNNNSFDKFKAKIKAESAVQVKAGFFTPEMVKIAKLQNYGGISKFSDEYRERARAKGIELPEYWHVVPRMFMNVAFDREKTKYGKIFVAAYKTTKKIISAANILGQFIKGNIKDSINEKYQKWQPNSDIIEQVKGKNTPLRDRGDMVDSVNYEVTEK